MKKLLLTIVFASVGLGLTACLHLIVSGLHAGADRGGENAGAAGGEQIRLSFWNTWVQNEPWQVVLHERIRQFERRNPGVVIQMQAIPHDQYKMKIKASAAGRELPDPFVVWPGAELTPLVQGQAVMPIDDLAQTYRDNLITADNLKDYAVDGRQYAIPTVMNATSIIYYDKDVLERAGYSEFPQTYGQFKQMVLAVRQLPMTPIALGNKAKWVLQSCYLSVIGSRYTGDDFLDGVLRGEKKFTDPAFVKALEVIKELADLNAFNDNRNEMDNRQQQELFLQGRAAMFIDGSWALPSLLQDLPEGRRLGIAVFPSVDGGDGRPGKVSGVIGQGVALNARLTEEEKQAAYALIQYLNSEEVYRELVGKQVLVPAQVPVPDHADESFRRMAELTGSGVSPVYDAILPPELIDLINDTLQEMTMPGGASPEEAAARMQAMLEEMAKQ